MTEEKGQSTKSEPTQIDKGTEPTGKSAGDVKEDVASLMETLEKLNVQSPDQLEGMFTASQQSGNMARLLGEERQARQQLEQQLAELQRQPRQRQKSYPESGLFVYDEDYGNPSANIDIEAVVQRAARQAVRDEVQETFIKPQQQSREQYNRDMKFIRNHKLYPLVKDKWQEHLSDYETQMRLQEGDTTLSQLFTDLAVDELSKTAMKMKEVYERDIMGKKTADQDPPHIETPTTETPAIEEGESEYIDKLVESAKHTRATDDDVDRMLNLVLPDDDALLQYGVEAAPIPQSKVPKKRKRT